MEFLLFIVMVPFFLCLFGAWMATLVKRIQIRLFFAGTERRQRKANRIEERLLAQGMSRSMAAYKARCRAFGYEEML